MGCRLWLSAERPAPAVGAVMNSMSASFRRRPPQGQGLHLVDGEGLIHGSRPGYGLEEGVDGVDLSLTGGHRLFGSTRGDS